MLDSPVNIFDDDHALIKGSCSDCKQTVKVPD